jgi:hypothetical protein
MKTDQELAFWELILASRKYMYYVQQIADAETATSTGRMAARLKDAIRSATEILLQVDVEGEE